MLETLAGGARLQLLPERAVFLPEHGTLLIADAHLGKAVSFRKLGLPVPAGTTVEALRRLDGLLQATGATHIVFLGDLLHAARSRSADTLDTVARWREGHEKLRLTLVRGNHDSHAGDPPADWGVACVDEPLPLAGLALCHHPDPRPGAYVLAGHLHPAVLLGGRAHERLRLPCFHLGTEVGVLPAFGAFTGMHVMKRGEGQRLFVIAGDEVRALPAT